MKTLTINQEFKNLITPLTQEELNQLEQNLIGDGCQSPIVIWNDTIIDGHNRYVLCLKNGIKFETIEKNLNDIDEAKQWIILNQFGRRNLDILDRAVLANQLKSIMKVNQGKRTDLQPCSILNKVDTKKEVSKLANVSIGTMHKVEKIMENGSEEVKKQLNNRQTSIDAAYKIVNPSDPIDLYDDNLNVDTRYPGTKIKKIDIKKNINDFLISDEGLNADEIVKQEIILEEQSIYKGLSYLKQETEDLLIEIRGGEDYTYDYIINSLAKYYLKNKSMSNGTEV